jgi:uroporphyrinogen decarboxylase
MQELTSKERLLIATTGGQPDRVPCAPDFSNMIPCRLTGRPFWDIYLHNDPPLWRAYIDAARYFGIDPWFWYAGPSYHRQYDDRIRWEKEIISRTDERIVERVRMITPVGELTTSTTFYRADPPTQTEKPITDLSSQRAFLPYLYRVPTGADFDYANQVKQYVGPEVAFGACIGYPGFQSWFGLVEGGVEALSYALVDCPDVLDELAAREEAVHLKEMQIILDSRLFDFVLLGASGSITLASPELFDRYALPTIRKLTKMCRQAGMPTMLHSCGKQMHLLRRCAEQTELDCANPLEIPPMGDCDLAEVKRLFGHRLALMGNLHTTDLMLRGTVEQVKAASRKAIDDAAAGGGFILSTGDQCGRDTPNENIRAMVEVCKTYGRYS